jgi:NAD(P)-dependent dehydrogenase (short-subunit alcohol dehydrogenase family)
MVKNQFAKSTIFITGASRGIGRATALAFAKEGAQVIIHFNSAQEHALETARQVSDAGGHAWTVQGDLSNADAVQKMASEIQSRGYNVDVLVNNAGALARAPFLEAPLEDLDQALNVNLRGPFFLSQVIARGMAKQKNGTIIFISSILARLAITERTAYCAAKGALESLVRTMALDLAPYNIRVNGIAPSLIGTDMLLSDIPDPQLMAQIQSHIPAQRLGEPEEIARAILFLASNESSYINGAILHADGALGARESGPV